MLNSRDIRDFPSSGQYDRAGPAPGQLPANKTLVPAVPARGSKICARLPPGSRVLGFSPGIQSLPGPGLAGRTLPARRRPMVYSCNGSDLTNSLYFIKAV